MVGKDPEKNSTRSEHVHPLVSIVTVVYNGEEFLERTIQNILAQVYTNKEYIIIDGGSTDGTIDIIRRYENHIEHWNSEADDGIYDAMNKGMRAATGDYVVFLNAGDSFATGETLAQVAEEIVNNNWPDIVYGNANVFSENGVFIKELKSLRFTALNLTLFGTRTVCHQSILIKKSLAPPYNLNYKLKGELAWYYDIMSIKQNYRILRLNIPISNYLLGGMSDSLFVENIKERLQVVIEKIGILGCVIVVPSLLIPIIFRLKRIIVSKMRQTGKQIIQL